MRREHGSDEVAVAGVAGPLLRDNTAVTTTWVSMATFKKVMFIVLVGATDTTVDAKLQSADDSSGTNAADITGKAATQLSGTDDNKQIVLNVNSDELNGDDDHVACVVTAGDGATGANTAVVAIGWSHYGAPDLIDLSTVAQIVD